MRCILLLFFIGIITINQTNAQSNTLQSAINTADWKTEIHDKYEIKYPGDWTFNDEGQMGTLFILLSPQSNATDLFQENINLIIQDLTGHNLDLDQYVEISEQQVKTILSADIESSERLEGDHGEYHRLVYAGKQGVYDLKFIQYFWVIRNEAFVLTFTAERDQFDANQALGLAILNSFVIK